MRELALRSRLIALLLLLGCTPAEQIPTYPKLSTSQVLTIIADRWRNLESGTGRGELTLESNGRSLTMDVVYVWKKPGMVRLRGWKFNQAVFDLTVLTDGVWIYSPRGGDFPSGVNSAQIARAVTYLIGGLGENIGDPTWRTVQTGNMVRLTRTEADGTGLQTNVDSLTATVRSCVITDTHGKEQFRLRMSRYAAWGSTIWPQRLEASSSMGRILLETQSFQPNVAAPGAFKPPSRAKELR